MTPADEGIKAAIAENKLAHLVEQHSTEISNQPLRSRESQQAAMVRIIAIEAQIANILTDYPEFQV